MISDYLPPIATALLRPTYQWESSKKVAAIVQFLTESHLFAFGGYPHDYMIIDDKWLVVADLDDGKERNRTSLYALKLSTVVKWYDEAVREWDDSRDCWEDFSEPIAETKPKSEA